MAKEEGSTSYGARVLWRRIFRHENVVLALVLLALVGGFSALTKGGTAAPQNVRNTLVQSSIRGVTAIGQATVILTSGIDVSVGGIATSAVLVGTGMMETGGLNIVGHSVSIYEGIA